MPEAEQPSEGELILYQTPGGAVRVEVLYEAETFWLNLKRIESRRKPKPSGEGGP